MVYTALKHLHLLTVAITLALFLLRAAWMLADSKQMQARWIRIVPHVNDTILLAAAIGMLVAGGLNPLQQPWIMAKIGGLLAYIGLGTVALRRGKTKAVRVTALLAALAVIAWIVAVAFTKQVIPGAL
jgi:uncharacterized membrane protein SirB2